RRLHGDRRRRDDRHDPRPRRADHGGAHVLPHRHHDGGHVRDRRPRPRDRHRPRAARAVAPALAGARGAPRFMSAVAASSAAPSARVSRRRAGGRSRAALGVAGALLVLAAWELCARFVWRDAQVLPAPSQALADAYRQLTAAELAQHVAFSLWRILAGFAIGALAGVALGVASGWYRGLARVTRPI